MKNSDKKLETISEKLTKDLPQKRKWETPELLDLSFDKTEYRLIGPTGDGGGPYSTIS